MLPVIDVTFPSTFLGANIPELRPNHRSSYKVVRLILPFSGKPNGVLVDLTAKHKV